jgi:hypothetical protein
MTNLEKIVKNGLLKNGEEIYLPYLGEEYSGRVMENGKKIKTIKGTHSSLSDAASSLYQENQNCKINKLNKNGTLPSNGWREWRTWNGVKLEGLRKKIIEKDKL